MSADSMTNRAPAPGVEPVIEGSVARGFEAVRDVFTANFLRDDACREVGAAVTVYRGDQCIVDLWGGFTSSRKAIPWRADTFSNVYSTTKGAVAFCLAMLVDRGVLRYEDRVASIWPEFAAAGKHDVTVSHVLSHEAGLPAFEEPTTLNDLLDWERCCRHLAAQATRWRPGEKTGSGRRDRSPCHRAQRRRVSRDRDCRTARSGFRHRSACGTRWPRCRNHRSAESHRSDAAAPAAGNATQYYESGVAA
jgi:hypothetical protein